MKNRIKKFIEYFLCLIGIHINRITTFEGEGERGSRTEEKCLKCGIKLIHEMDDTGWG